MPLQLPSALTDRYRGENYIARMPFLLNSYLDGRGMISTLARKKPGEKDLFVGIPGFHSLDMLALTGTEAGGRYRQAVLFDTNAMQVKAMNAVLRMIDVAETPTQFIEAFARRYHHWISAMPREGHPRQSDEDRAYFATHGKNAQPESEEDIVRQLTVDKFDPQSWLHPRNFLHIKQLVAQGRIATAMIDLKDDDRMAVFKDWLQKEQFRVGDLYLSSSLLFMDPRRHFDYYSKAKSGDAMRFLHNLITLTDDQSRVLLSAPVPPPMDFTARLHYKPFILVEKNKEVLQQLLREWAEEPAVGAAHKHYHYLFQIGATALQVSPEGRPDRDGDRRLLKIAAANGDLSPPEEEIIRQGLKRAGLDIVAPSIYDREDAVKFVVDVGALEREDFFTGLETLVRQAFTTQPMLARAR